MSANLIGQVLSNQFRVDAFVAAGGMGAVYRVWDLKRNTPLAMKVLHAELAEDPSIFKRFQREANALKKLTHPNIVPFYGLEKTSDFAFLLEQYIDGPSLKEILKEQKQPLTIYETLAYLKALSAALGYAHVHGVIHCDVKPGNVMINKGGNIFLTDFGIARHADSTTTTLATVGTAAYMAPEQILGEAVGPETDIYALGVMLFEMLTRQRPFLGSESGTESAGKTANERIRFAHLRLEPPDPMRLNPSIPYALSRVITKALSKQSENRYSSSRELYEAACSAAETSPEEVSDRVFPPLSLVPQPATTPSPVGQAPFIEKPAGQSIQTDGAQTRHGQRIPDRLRNGKGLLLAGGGLVSIILIIFMVFSGGISGFGGITPTPTIDTPIISVETSLPVASPTTEPSPTRTPRPTATPRPSPTPLPTQPGIAGLNLAFASDRDGEFRSYLVRTDNMSDWVALTLPRNYERIWWPSFCGEKIAVEAYDVDSQLPQWIFFVDPLTKETEKWEPPTSVNSLGVPRCSPNGQYLAYSAHVGNWALHLYDFFNRKRSPIDNSQLAGYVSWPLAGDDFYYMSQTDRGNPFLVMQASIDQGTKRYVEGKYPALSPDGSQLIYFCSNDLSLCLEDLLTGESTQLQKITYKSIKIAIPSTAAWSADGEWIYFSSAADGDWDIYRIRPDGSDPENITKDWPSNEIMPAIQW